MIKFLKNLFNIGKKKEDFIEVELDRANGIMTVRSTRDLSMKDLIDILRKELGDS